MLREVRVERSHGRSDCRRRSASSVDGPPPALWRIHVLGDGRVQSTGVVRGLAERRRAHQAPVPVLADHGVDEGERFVAVGADLHEDRRAVVDLKLARLRGPDGLSLVGEKRGGGLARVAAVDSRVAGALDDELGSVVAQHKFSSPVVAGAAREIMTERHARQRREVCRQMRKGIARAPSVSKIARRLRGAEVESPLRRVVLAM